MGSERLDAELQALTLLRVTDYVALYEAAQAARSQK